MLLGKWMLPILCAGAALAAQPLRAQILGDLNGLAQASAHYCSHGMAAERDPQSLELYRMIGDQAADGGSLMTRGVDVTHWQFQYKLVPFGAPAGLEAAAAPHLGVTDDCVRGIFCNFQYQTAMVMDARSLEYAWIAISLDDALAQVKGHGYSGKFSRVTLMRPMNPNIPDEYVYIFECPDDHARVAISTQTGNLMWTEPII